MPRAFVSGPRAWDPLARGAQIVGPASGGVLGPICTGPGSVRAPQCERGGGRKGRRRAGRLAGYFFVH